MNRMLILLNVKSSGTITRTKRENVLIFILFNLMQYLISVGLLPGVPTLVRVREGDGLGVLFGGRGVSMVTDQQLVDLYIQIEKKIKL